MDNVSTSDWRGSSAYQEAMVALQSGKWDDALNALRSLEETSPQDQSLKSLITETELRAESTLHPVRARRFTFLNKRVMFVALLMITLAGIGWSAQAVYATLIAPSMSTTQAAKEQEQLVSAAKQAYTKGDNALAIELYGQLGQLNPEHPALVEGLGKAQQAQTLDATYQVAQQQMTQGAVEEALKTFVGIQQQSPSYRDVSVLIGKLERQQRLTELVRQVNVNRAGGKWDVVVARLEEALPLTTGAEQDQLKFDLYQARMSLAGELIDASGGQVEAMNRAIELYGSALSLKPQDPQALKQRNNARRYLAGYEAFAAGRWDDAIAQLELLYRDTPDYLVGKAAELLYSAYMRSAELLTQNNNLMRAWERYTRASELEGINVETAKVLAQAAITQLTPTPTAAPTPVPVPVSAPPVYYAPAAKAPAPTPRPADPTPTPTPDFAYLLVEAHAGGAECGGEYIYGTVTDAAGIPLPNVRLRLHDGWGNAQETATKNAPAGQYDFPLYGLPRQYWVTVIDGSGTGVSSSIGVEHRLNDKIACHYVNFRQK